MTKNGCPILINNDFSSYSIQDSRSSFGALISPMSNPFDFLVFFSPFSYKNAINDGIVEYYDVLNKDTKETEKDWEHQVDAWQGFFEADYSREFVEGVNASTMWWDNAMDPDVKVKISISPSIRNKPAEEVIKQWFNN